MSDGTPIVFVVDDDVSVRESLELLIRCEGWQPETERSRMAWRRTLRSEAIKEAGLVARSVPQSEACNSRRYVDNCRD